MTIRPTNATLRAVVTETPEGFLVSASFSSSKGEPTIVLDEIVLDIRTALQKVEDIALRYDYQSKKISWLYNLQEGIRTTLPKRLK